MTGVTINWETRVISVEKAYLTPTANPDIFNLDTNVFRLDLKGLESSEEGMSYPDTHQHNTEVPLGGIIYARVIEIINGYTITFENGFYAVNLFGSNNNIGDVVNLNFVSIRTNNSAGLIVDPSISESLDYGDSIVYDEINGMVGNRYPIGTRASPVNNIVNLKELLSFYNRNNVVIISDINITDTFESVSFRSETAEKYMNNSGFTMMNCQMENIIINGDYNNSHLHCKNCEIGDVQNVGGLMANCNLSGTLSMTATEPLTIKHSVSIIPGTNSPIIDMVLGQSALLNLRDYSGGITIINCDSSGDTATIEMSAGKIHLDSSNIDGLIDCRGLAMLDDNSNGTTVLTNALLDPSNISLSGSTGSGATASEVAIAVWEELTSSHNTNGTFGKLLTDLIIKADLHQHTLNVNTDLLNNKPNNP